MQSEWDPILGGTALTAGGSTIGASLLEPRTLLDPMGLLPATDQLNPTSRPQITPAAFGIQTAAFAGLPSDAPGDGDYFQHRAVQEAFILRHPGAQMEVSIPGAPGPNGQPGRADLVYGNMIWEVKPDKPWWTDGTGQAQLNRYLAEQPGSVPGNQESFVVPYGTGELVVNSRGWIMVGAKLLSPACGPLAPVCAVVL